MRPRNARQPRPAPLNGVGSAVAAPAAADVADQLHSAAIHLLRWLRRVDGPSGISGPRLSALSVIVAAGPITLGDLAAAEQVRPPTITRLVTALEAEGLVTREADPHDGRITRVRATARGQAMLAAGRARRVATLARELAALSPEERAGLAATANLMERLARRPD